MRGPTKTIASLVILTGVAVVFILVTMARQFREGEADSTRIMATICVSREAAIILRQFYESTHSLPSRRSDINALINASSNKIECSSFYPHFEGKVPIDSFGHPLEYWIGSEQVAVFSRSPTRYFGLDHHVFLVRKDEILPLSFECSRPGPFENIYPDLVEFICQSTNSTSSS